MLCARIHTAPTTRMCTAHTSRAYALAGGLRQNRNRRLRALDVMGYRAIAMPFAQRVEYFSEDARPHTRGGFAKLQPGQRTDRHVRVAEDQHATEHIEADEDFEAVGVGVHGILPRTHDTRPNIR